MSAKTQVKATSEPLNKGFIQVVERFIGEGWKLVEDTKTQIVFVNPKNIYDEFKINIFKVIMRGGHVARRHHAIFAPPGRPDRVQLS